MIYSAVRPERTLVLYRRGFLAEFDVTVSSYQSGRECRGFCSANVVFVTAGLWPLVGQSVSGVNVKNSTKLKPLYADTDAKWLLAKLAKPGCVELE